MLRKHCFSFLLALSLLFLAMPHVFAQTLSKGAEAPVFKTEASQAGNEFTFSLKEALAKGPVVLYFYPAAYTGGCDLEAHTFAEYMDKFAAVGTTVIGVSADDIQRLNTFSADPDFCAGKFPVASDADGAIAATYGLKLIPPQEGVKDAKGQPVTHGFIPRTTFVINKDGEILAVFSSETDKISPVDHVQKSLEIVKAL